MFFPIEYNNLGQVKKPESFSLTGLLLLPISPRLTIIYHFSVHILLLSVFSGIIYQLNLLLLTIYIRNE